MQLISGYFIQFISLNNGNGLSLSLQYSIRRHSLALLDSVLIVALLLTPRDCFRSLFLSSSHRAIHRQPTDPMVLLDGGEKSPGNAFRHA